MAHTCNPSTLGGQGRWITWGQEFDQHGETPSLPNYKVSWAWWQVPVIPAIQEAEAWKPLEPGRQRLQWAEIIPLTALHPRRQSETLSQKRVSIFNAIQVLPLRVSPLPSSPAWNLTSLSLTKRVGEYITSRENENLLWLCARDP